MAQTVIITLTTAGADTGPFDLYSNIDGFVVPFESNVSKIDLEAGYISFLVPDTTTTIRVQSDNPLCNNFIDLLIPTTTTTTTAILTTTTTTIPPTTTTTTTYCSEGCLGYEATGEGVPDTLFWYITCEGIYTEVTVDFSEVFPFCACDKPDQYSTVDVTIFPTGAC